MLLGATGSGLLLVLALLACPLGMGLMMFFMSRGMRGGMRHDSPERDKPSLADLKAEQARLAERIEALDVPRAVRQEPQVTGASEEQPDRVT